MKGNHLTISIHQKITLRECKSKPYIQEKIFVMCLSHHIELTSE